MKKSYRFISVLLALVMIVSLVPGMAFAAETEKSEFDVAGILSLFGLEPADLGSVDISKLDVGSVLGLIQKLKVPTLCVLCTLSNNMPAANATVTLTNQLTGETIVRQANSLGLALIPKGLIGVYTIAATCDGPVTGVKYSTLPGLKWSAGAKIDIDNLVLYPVLDIGLNYSDHFYYMVGYKDGTVRPNANITRAEATSLIYRLMTPEARGKYLATTNSFNDVTADNPHNIAISTLTKAGIISGYSSTCFGPNDYITRGQFAAIIGRMFSVSYTGGDMFADLNGDFSDQYINLLANLGIMKGDGMGNAKPNSLVTRAHAAAMLNRLFGRLPEAQGIDSCPDKVKQWPDNPRDAWYYADILEATNSHDYTWSSDLSNVVNDEAIICEKWTAIRTEAPDWTSVK